MLTAIALSWCRWWGLVLLLSRSHRREQKNLADGRLSRHEHHEPINTESQPGSGRHAMIERLREVFIWGVRFVVALGCVALLLREADTLLIRVVELRVGVAQL